MASGPRRGASPKWVDIVPFFFSRGLDSQAYSSYDSTVVEFKSFHDFSALFLTIMLIHYHVFSMLESPVIWVCGLKCCFIISKEEDGFLALTERQLMWG